MKTMTRNVSIAGIVALLWGMTVSWGGENGYVKVWGTLDYDMQSVPPAALSNTTAIAAGWYHCLALANGRVYAWGDNECNQTTVHDDALAGVTAIAAGASSSAAIKNGKIVLWGKAQEYATMDDDFKKVPTNGLYKVVALGANHGLAIREDDGKVEAWGNDARGQQSGPGRDWGPDILEIAAGEEFSMGLNKNGKVFVSGHPMNVDGVSLRIDEIPETIQSNVTAIAAGPYHAMALDKDGRVWVWGAWKNPDVIPIISSKPLSRSAYGNVTNVPESAQSGVTAIAAGLNTCAALKQDGSIVIWGNEAGSGSVHSIPACAARDVKEIALGFRHAMARTAYLPPAIETESLPDGYVQSPYDGGVSALGDPAPVFFLADQRPFPKGLTLDRDTGRIAGVPETVASNTFFVAASNAYGIDQKVFTLVVNPRELQVPTWETDSLPPAVVGTWYEVQLQATENPVYSLDATGEPLPGWAELTPAGVIQGWPDEAGSSSWPTFIAANAAGATTNQPLELKTVTPTNLPVIGAQGTLPDGINGIGYGGTNAVPLPGGGVAAGVQLDIQGAVSVSWPPVEGSLPTGLVLRGTNGVFWIEGTPQVTGENAVFVLEAANAAGTTRGTWSISVKGKPEWATPGGALPDGAVGVPYRAEVAARWAEAYRLNGTLPNGLTMGTGEGEEGVVAIIDGTPTAVTGEMEFEILASNAYDGGQPVSGRFTIQVLAKLNPALKFTGIVVKNGTTELTWTDLNGEKTEAWVGYTDDLNEGWPTNGTPSSLGWVKTNSPAKLSGGPGPRFYMLQPAD